MAGRTGEGSAIAQRLRAKKHCVVRGSPGFWRGLGMGLCVIALQGWTTQCRIAMM